MWVFMLSHFSHIWLFATLWTIACQAPLSMEFSRHEYWCGLPCPLPGDLPYSGIKPMSLTSPALEGRFLTTSATRVLNKMTENTLCREVSRRSWCRTQDLLGKTNIQNAFSCISTKKTEKKHAMRIKWNEYFLPYKKAFGIMYQGP